MDDETIDDILEHVGIKGMHWGVRRSRAADGRVRGPSKSTRGGISPDAARAKESHSTAKKHGLSALSNQDLQHLVSRMNLEQQYSRLTTSPTKTTKARLSSGFNAVKTVLGVAKTAQEAHRLATSPEMMSLKSAINKSRK
jgi:hypothetical protein